MSNNAKPDSDNGLTMKPLQKKIVFYTRYLDRMVKNILFAFLLLLICTKSFSAVFVVTSNADSGPGTLRDALTQAAANGSSTTDYINFNLPDLSVAGRTITLLSQLPEVSSNLVIDGTTQPGARFGVSDAKVRIMTKFVYPVNLNILYSSSGDHIEIYGLWLWGDVSGWGGLAFHFRNFGSLRIGAPSKGNIIELGNIGLDTGRVCYFQNNICWTDTTGEKPSGGVISVISCDSLTFGGSVTTGNVAAGIINLFFSNPVSNYLQFSYNKLGTDFTGTKAPYGFNLIDETRVTIQAPYANNGQPTYIPLYATITNNIIADVYGFNLLQVTGFGGKIVIQGNAFNTDFAGKLNFNEFSQSIAAYAIACSGNKDVLIGGDLPSEKNLIAYCEDGIGYSNDAKYTITRNSIFCVGEISFIGFTGLDKLPQVSIKTISSNSIKGTATPNSTVELFNADCSCSIPTPKDYFITVKADGSGNWSYNGAVNGYIMASATLDSLTSLFAGLNIDDSKMHIVNAGCNAVGSITGIVTQYTSGFQWLNDQGALVGTNLDLTNVPAGKYTLKINSGSACSFTKTYEILSNAVIVDVSKVKLNLPTCAGKGSITGIAISSAGIDPVTYHWIDQNGNVQCDCLDFYNANPGKYTFVISHNDGSCNQTFGPYDLSFTKAITLDESKVQVREASCNLENGSITGMQVFGDAQYKWINASNQVVATTADLRNATPGDYTFAASNSYGCTQISKSYHVGSAPPTQFPAYSAVVTPSCFLNANGSVSVAMDSLVQSVRWVDNQGNTIGNNMNLTNAPAGTYQLYVTDKNGCESFYNKYTIDQIPALQLALAQVNNDQCSSGAGSITGATVSGGKPPYTYNWTDINGNVISAATELNGLLPGSYTLTVTDASGCNSVTAHYTVHDEQANLPAPSANNVQVCSPGDALLVVNNPVLGYGYRLYDSESSSDPIAQSTNGRLNFTAKTNTTLYISEFKGECVSSRTSVQVIVGVSSLNIPNTITPNGDGINDYWTLPGIENYPNALVQVFTRYGQQVYQSRGYAHPFDGTLNGQPLPVGVYYYIINLNSNCNLLTGNLTIIR